MVLLEASVPQQLLAAPLLLLLLLLPAGLQMAGGCGVLSFIHQQIADAAVFIAASRQPSGRRCWTTLA
jgi:hypothetical protein